MSIASVVLCRAVTTPALLRTGARKIEQATLYKGEKAGALAQRGIANLRDRIDTDRDDIHSRISTSGIGSDE